MLTRDNLPDEIVTARTVVRKTLPKDLPVIEDWPRYPGLQYGCFDMTGPSALSADGDYWWRKIDRCDRCHYSVVHKPSGDVIGVHAFTRIDWARPVIGNVAIRIRADLCGKGFGSETLDALLRAVLDTGMKSVRLDVAATNARAIACYRKCGMRITEEFWQEHSGDPPQMEKPEWAFAVPHLRKDGPKWLVRFYRMAIP